MHSDADKLSNIIVELYSGVGPVQSIANMHRLGLCPVHLKAKLCK